MKFCYIIFLLALSANNSFSQDSSAFVFRLSKLPPDGAVLDKNWKFKAGDNPEWARQNYDDTKWTNVELSDYNTYLPKFKNKNIGWFRLNLLVDSSIQKKQIAIQLSQLGASEIYLNGVLFQQFGSIEMPSNFKSFNPFNKPFLLPSNTGNLIVIAIRFASTVPSRTWLFTNAAFRLDSSINNLPLTIKLNYWDDAIKSYVTNLEQVKAPAGISYMTLTLALLFVLLYIFFPKEKINLLFGAFCFFLVTRNLILFLLSEGNLDMNQFAGLSFLLDLNDRVEGILVASIIAQEVLHRITVYHWIIFGALGIDSLMLLFFGSTYVGLILNVTLHIAFPIVFFHLCVKAFSQRKFVLGIVALNSSILNIFITLIALANLNPKYFNLLYFFAVNFILITLYVSINFARKSKNLEIQLVEIEKLSYENLKKEKEKQQLLASQNETLEQKVVQRTSELKQSLEELKATQSQLIQSEKMASLGELTAGIAHEIQNPLNFVNNFSDVNTELIEELQQEANKGNIDEVKSIANDLKENEQKINHHGKRADAIVKGMLQHSRASSGKKEPTDINALADEYLRLSYHGMRAKDKEFNATIETSFDESIGKIELVPQDVGRVLLNLYNNAFYAVNEKKKQINGSFEPMVSVSTKRLGDKIEIIVRDNGFGIPPKILDKIFQPFFTTKPTGQGTGLGLSLSYDIIKAHGGELKVESTEGEGTEFIIELAV